MSDERRIEVDWDKFNEIQATKIDLKPGDVLMVTVKSDEITKEDMFSLRDVLKSLFPNNKVALFNVGEEGYVKFTVASQQEVSYCSNCDCGKKEQAEKEKKDASKP